MAQEHIRRGVNGGRRVLVTGADGVVGRWVVTALLERGDDVVLLRRPGARRSALALEGTDGHCAQATGDLRDPDAVRAALAAQPCQDVVHLAGQSIVDAALAAPRQTYEVNVAGTWNLLDACTLQGVERVVVASSDKVYGPPAHLPLTEEHPLGASSPYGVSKASTELMARAAWATTGLRVAVARLSNVYGGGDLHPSRLVPGLVGAVLAGRPPVLRTDGTPERDFLFAQDAAAAYLALLDATGEGGGAAGEACNAGSGTAHAVREVAELLLELAGSDLEPEYGPSAGPGADRQWLDPGKLERLTGWRPRVDLREGLARTLAWYAEHPAALVA